MNHNALFNAPPPLITKTLPGTIVPTGYLHGCSGCSQPCSTCHRPRPFIILGCGTNPVHDPHAPATIDLDIRDFQQPVIHNLEFPLPFPAQFAQHIDLIHVLEHIHNVHQLLCEVWRVLAFDGTATIVVPFFHSQNAPGDLTHVRQFSAVSLNYCFHGSAKNHPLVWPYQPFALRAKTVTSSEQITWNLYKPCMT